MGRAYCAIGLTLSLALMPAAAASAQVRFKTARICAPEDGLRKPRPAVTPRRRSRVIARCRVAPVGSVIPNEDEASRFDLESATPHLDFRDGFMFTPAYLSSPQVFSKLSGRPN